MRATEPTTAKAVRTERERVVIVLADREVQIPWEDCSTRLAKATKKQRAAAELSPGGYGVHWPELDEDLSISGLLRQADQQT